MKLPQERICTLHGWGRSQVIWRPRIMTSSSRIMAWSIIRARSEDDNGHLGNALPGEDVMASRAVHLFQLQTQRMRLTDREAAGLYAIVNQVMKQERRYPFAMGR